MVDATAPIFIDDVVKGIDIRLPLFEYLPSLGFRKVPASLWDMVTLGICVGVAKIRCEFLNTSMVSGSFVDYRDIVKIVFAIISD